MPIKKFCQFCNKIYFARPSRAEKRKYCSMQCAGKDIARIHKPKLQKVRNSIEYLLLYVKINKKTKCWEWQLCKDKCGYGNKKFNGKTQKAHRIFYEFYKGKIPKGLCVLHKCDNPACCNPDHLFIGSRIDNNKDMIKKNRQKGAIGESNAASKLTEKDVIEIRRLYKEGLSSRKLGRKFNVSKSTILDIVNEKSWNHI